MRKLMLAVMVFCIFGFSGAVKAESYVSAYLGAALSHDDHVQDNTGAGTPGTIEFDPGMSFGIKAGRWFESIPALGLQFDLNGHFPHSEKFTYDFSGFLVPVNLDVDFMMVSSITANAMVRYPKGNIRPYAGVGAGVFNAKIDDGNMTVLGTTTKFEGDSDTSFGWQALAGVDLAVSPKISVFAEYKYSRADFEFGNGIGLDVKYEANQLYGGVTYHF